MNDEEASERKRWWLNYLKNEISYTQLIQTELSTLKFKTMKLDIIE